MKEMNDESPDEQFLLCIDASAHTLAEEMNFPCNKVKLISAAEFFPGKKNSLFPASLHSFAPGESVESKLPWNGFDLQQRIRFPGSLQYEKYGPLSPERSGLSHIVIQTMSKHQDLQKLAALDTFLGNADRSPPNIYYNNISNSFCGIDLAAAFNRNLSVTP